MLDARPRPGGISPGMPRAERVEWVDHIVGSRLQTIGDVAVARMGTVAVIAGDGDATPVIDALLDCALAASMRAPHVDAGRRSGVIAALEAFAKAHGRSAEALFEESADEEAFGG